jgi:hypothetical protein
VIAITDVLAAITHPPRVESPPDCFCSSILLPEVHEQWYTILLAGTYWDNGMTGFADPPKFAFPHLRMTIKQADAIHAYVIDGAWKAYKGERETESADPAHKK